MHTYNPETIKKITHIVQKWLEVYISKLNLDEDKVTKAKAKVFGTSPKTLHQFSPLDEETSVFIQTWMETGFLCGYLTGSEISNLKGNWLAKEFAHSLTITTFDRLTEDPVSPLVKELDVKLLRLLRHIHESSLYTGFLSGALDVAREQETFDLEDLDKILN